MIGSLPKELVVAGVKYHIRSDYRLCLHIMRMFKDKDMSEYNRLYTMLELLYKEIPADMADGIKQASWFLNCGKEQPKSQTQIQPRQERLMDWEQDEQIIFAGITDVAGHDIRNDKYCHWWTFIGYYMSISGESIFHNIISIRRKLYKKQKLEKYEQEFYKNNEDMIDLKGGLNAAGDRMAEFLRTGVK